MKDHEKQLKLIEEETKKEKELIAPTVKPISELPDEKINSLKVVYALQINKLFQLLENLPTSQREILEAAIRSGEIDEDGLAPAIGYVHLITYVCELTRFILVVKNSLRVQCQCPSGKYTPVSCWLYCSFQFLLKSI